MDTLNEIQKELNSLIGIKAKMSKDLRDNETIFVEFCTIPGKYENIKKLEYIYNMYPEIYISHAFNGFSGNEFEYSINVNIEMKYTPDMGNV